MKGTDYGLTTDHAYTVLQALELKKDGKTAARIVKVRNPWNKEWYNGPFSPNSLEWTDSFKKQANYSQMENGQFWVPLHVYKETMTWLFVGYTNNYVDTQQYHITGKNRVYIYELDNPVDQEIFITADAMSPRNYPSVCPTPARVNVYLMKGWKPIAVTYTSNGGTGTMGSTEGFKMKKGKYRIYYVNWDYATKSADVYLQINSMT